MPREAWTTGRIHARLNALPAPDGLATAHERVREWIRNVEVPPHLAQLAEETLAGLDGGDRFCHSDFHPGNILLEPNGPPRRHRLGLLRRRPGRVGCRPLRGAAVGSASPSTRVPPCE